MKENIFEKLNKNDVLKCWTKEKGIEATKWLINEKLKWSEEDIKHKLSRKVFIDNGLQNMLQKSFNGSPYEAINELYPNKFKPWELNKVPRNYWTKERGIEATKWLIEDKLKWSDNDIKDKLNRKVFIANGLDGMLVILFNGSPYEAINELYPNKFKPWELNNIPKSYWTKETGIEAIKRLIEDKLKWSDNDIKDKLTGEIFKKNNLHGMIQKLFNGSPYQAINETYPNKFKPWELSVSKSYWTKERGIEATKWLIEDKLKWSDNDIKNKLTSEIFNENGLIGMLQVVFKSSPYEAINETYPNKFKPWELSSVPKNYWTKERGIEATKWLIEYKLKWSKEDIKVKLTINIFKKNGLYGMLQSVFNGSPDEAISQTYLKK